MSNSIETDNLMSEKISASFDGVSQDSSSSDYSVENRKKWETYALISDVMRKKQSEHLIISDFANKVKVLIANEPSPSRFNLNLVANWLKSYFKKIPVLIAAPALAMGLVLVILQPSADQTTLAIESEMPKLMDTFCKLHENGTGGAALC